MRSFIAAVLAGCAIAQKGKDFLDLKGKLLIEEEEDAKQEKPWSQCKNDIAEAQTKFLEVKDWCETGHEVLNKMHGAIPSVSAVLPKYNKMVVKNNDNVSFQTTTNTNQDKQIRQLQVRLAAVQMAVADHVAAVNIFHEDLTALTGTLDKLEGLETLELGATVQTAMAKLTIGGVQQSLDDIDMDPLKEAQTKLDAINALSDPTDGKIAATLEGSINLAETMVAIEANVAAQVVNYEYYWQNKHEMYLNSWETQLASFFVCEGDLMEFWLNLAIEGLHLTQIQSLALFAGDGKGNKVGDPLVQTTLHKSTALSTAEELSLFYKTQKSAYNQEYLVYAHATVARFATAFPANAFQWGYRTRPQAYAAVATTKRPTQCAVSADSPLAVFEGR